MKFCTGVIDEIKKLWPGTILVTGKPWHSKSNGGVEQCNRTVEEKIASWMHTSKSTHWAQALPFIQWCCNTQVHCGICGRMPYHLVFGQNPQVGISNLPIASKVLESLATEMDVSCSMHLPSDVPLEDVNMGAVEDEFNKASSVQKKKHKRISKKECI